MKCQTCGGPIQMITLTREKMGAKGKLVVHNVPAEKCECNIKFSFRPLLIIEDYTKKMSKDIEFVEYEHLEEIYSKVPTQNLL